LDKKEQLKDYEVFAIKANTPKEGRSSFHLPPQPLKPPKPQVRSERFYE